MDNVKVKIRLIDFFLKIPKGRQWKKRCHERDLSNGLQPPSIIITKSSHQNGEYIQVFILFICFYFHKCFSLWLEYCCWDIPPILLTVYFQWWTHLKSLSEWDSHMMTSVMTRVKRAVVTLCCLLCHLSPSLVSSVSSSVSVVNSKIKNMKGEEKCFAIEKIMDDHWK